ncbi:methyltransferase [Amycolatopsis sp. cg5]|uniref:methyltransferase n=1 Tax=Amycolatopsis sp. cg5 TaxID=3238802 RepID=UPI003523AA7E
MARVEAASGVDAPTATVALFQLITGHHESSAIHVAAKLKVADLLADGPRKVAELAAETSTDEDSLQRLLRLLVSSGVLTEPEAGVFALSPVGHHLRSDQPDSLYAVAMTLASPGHVERWAGLTEVLETGKTALHDKGKAVFSEPPPEVIALLSQSMTFFSTYTVGSVVGNYDFSGCSTVVDVGGGLGSLLAAVVTANPGVRGILLDQPFLREATKKHLANTEGGDKIEAIAGDFFESVPEGGDVYILKSVIHDWDDDRSVEILKSCHRAMRPGARLLLVETVCPERFDDSVPSRIAARSDVMMLLSSPGGRERTEADFQKLLETAGFELSTVTPVRPAWTGVQSTTLLEAIRR